MSFVTVPGRTLTTDEIKRYHDDGVVMIKQAIDPNWLRLIEAGVSARTSCVAYGPFAHGAQQLMARLKLRSAPLKLQQTWGRP